MGIGKRAAGTPASYRAFQLLMGLWATQVGVVLARLSVPDQLAGGPRLAGSVAEEIGADRDAMLRLLRAAATLGWVSEVGRDRYQLTTAGEFLRGDSPGSMREQALAIGGSPRIWGLYADLGQVVMTGRSTATDVLGGSLWDYYAAHPEEAEHFCSAMAAISAGASADIVAAMRPPDHGRIVDVGGTHGELLAALLARAPRAQGVLFDRPQVIEEARRRLTDSPVADRIELCGGDFFDTVPQADLYLLKWVIHNWDDERAHRILTTCRQAAAPAARIAVIEQLLPEPWAPSPAHLFDLVMFVQVGGKERTESEYRALLDASGWRLEQVTATSGLLTVLQAAAV